MVPDQSSLSRPAKRRNPLLAMLAANALWGGALGVAFVIGVIALDLGHLRKLLTFTPDGMIALGLLTIGSIATFASVVMGGAVMMMARENDKGPRGGRRVLRHLVPARVTVAARRSGRSAHPTSE